MHDICRLLEKEAKGVTNRVKNDMKATSMQTQLEVQERMQEVEQNTQQIASNSANIHRKAVRKADDAIIRAEQAVEDASDQTQSFAITKDSALNEMRKKVISDKFFPYVITFLKKKKFS
ncbi:MAG: hypothetical protein PV340_01190 [Wolbachia sp.]|nr:hypothetical protein [Wolbachia sp.]MDD9336387.1 hypothetical protein [Wolbachia sp.]